jgi:hypothetical protein
MQPMTYSAEWAEMLGALFSAMIGGSRRDLTRARPEGDIPKSLPF